MAGQSLSPSASSTSDSIMSTIHVNHSSFSSSQMGTDESASPSPTPPTSVTGDSARDDAASVKQDATVTASRQPSEAASGSVAVASIENDSTRRRSVRSKLSVESYNLAELSDMQLVKKNAAKLDGPRSFSGDTLVNDAADDQSESGGARDLRRQVLEGEVDKALDMAWQVGDLEDERPCSAGPSEAKSSKSTSMTKISKAAGKIRSALGKRSRDNESDAGSKRVSKSNSVLDMLTSKSSDDTSEEQPASKKARLMNTLAEMTSAIGRSVTTKKLEKRWLDKGLFCGQDAAFTGTLSSSKQLKTTGESSDAATKLRIIMPYPMYSAGTREADFKIPYNIFAPLKKKENPKEWKKLSKNSFTPSAKEVWRTKKLERSVCLCTTPALGAAGCDDACLNRIMGYECDDSNCSLSADQCTNRAFAELAKRIKDGNEFDVGVEIIKTKECGHGLRSNRAFAPGQIIIEYCGEVITQEESDRRMNEIYKDASAYYLMEFDQGMIIDATKGNITRFVNHSCAPNCLMEKRIVRGEPKMALFAGPAGVSTGEELSYDYNFDNFSSLSALDCRCGAEFCRGKLMRRDAKKEKENLAASLKRKVEEAMAAASASATPEPSKGTVLKKRRTARWSKGWAYIDPEMEAERLKEDAIEKGTNVDIRKVELIRQAEDKVDDRKVNIVLKEHGKRGASLKAKEKMLERAASIRSMASEKREKREKRKSLLSRAGSLLRHATPASLQTDNDDGETREEQERMLKTESADAGEAEAEEDSFMADEDAVIITRDDSVASTRMSEEVSMQSKKPSKQSTIGFVPVNGKTAKTQNKVVKEKAPKKERKPKKASPLQLEELDEDVDVLEMVFSGGAAARAAM